MSAWLRGVDADSLSRLMGIWIRSVLVNINDAGIVINKIGPKLRLVVSEWPGLPLFATVEREDARHVLIK